MAEQPNHESAYKWARQRANGNDSDEEKNAARCYLDSQIENRALKRRLSKLEGLGDNARAELAESKVDDLMKALADEMRRTNEARDKLEVIAQDIEWVGREVDTCRENERVAYRNRKRDGQAPLAFHRGANSIIQKVYNRLVVHGIVSLPDEEVKTA